MSYRRSVGLGLLCALCLVGCEGKAPAGLREGTVSLQQISQLSTLSATAVSTSQVNLAWIDGADNETGWEVDRASSTGRFDPIASLGANTTAYSDLGLTSTTQYCYKVRSFRTVGRKTTYSAFTSPACATTLTSPPTGTAARPLSSTVIGVTWSSGGSTPSGFRVERAAASDGPWTAAATTNGTTQSYQDAGRTSE